MKSHTSEFDAKDLLRLIGGPLVIVAAFALVMQVGAALNVLPRPRPALDVDRTILIHQAEASRLKSDADILLLGDSSCLMDVSATQLTKQLGRRVLNLGTLSYLDLQAYSLLLREFAAANPGQTHVVVLLLHPEALRRVGSEPYQLDVLRNFLAGREHCRDSASGKISCLLGVDIFRGRIVSRVLPAPLGGSYGRLYGFSADLERFIDRHNGSAIDPGSAADPVRQPRQGHPEYRLSEPLEAASRIFKAAVPPGVKVVAGITPAPAAFSGSKYPQQQRAMLEEWGRWLEADALLFELPATMPDEQFARTTHLNASAVETYTEQLARALQPHLR